MRIEVIIALLAVAIALVSIVIALIVIIKNRNKQKKSPLIRVEARLMKLYSQTKTVNKNFSSSTVDQASGYEVTNYFVEFKPKDQVKVSFSLKKKIWLSLHEGEQGYLSYKGNQMISFNPFKQLFDESHELYFKSSEQDGGKTIDFYGESNSLDISIPSNQKVKVNINGLIRLAEDLKSDNSDWFIVLSKSKLDYMQIEKESKTKLSVTYSLENKNEIMNRIDLHEIIKKYTEET